MSTSSFHQPLALLLAAVLVLGTLLGSRGLNEPDEGRYAEIGREMAASGDLLLPHLNGFLHFSKPPVIYWATALSLRLFGVNEWAARLPSALAALGTVLLTAWIGGALFGRSTGLAAGVVLLTSAGFFAIARLLTPDMTLTFWTVAAVACFLRYAHLGKGRLWAWLFFAMMGCGFLTKGPMALIVPLSAVLAWQRLARREAGAVRLPWAGGMLLTLVIGLSWFIALSCWQHGLFRYFWHYELVERFASHHHGRAKPIWFFAPVTFGALLPWSLLMVPVGMAAWRRWRERRFCAPEWFLLSWVLVPFLVLSLSGSKLSTYILPLLPPLALAAARWATRRGTMPAWLPTVAAATALLLLAGAAAMPHFNNRLGPQGTVRDLARQVVADPDFPSARVCAVEVRADGLEFYLQRLVSVSREQADLIVPATAEQEQRLFPSTNFASSMIEPGPGTPPVFVLTRQQRVKASFDSSRWQTLGSAGDFVLLKSQPAPVARAASAN